MKKLKSIVRLSLCVILSFVMIVTLACGKSTIAKVSQKSKQIVDYLAVIDIPAMLVTERLITEEEAMQLRAKIEDYRSVITNFNNQIQAAIQNNLNLALLAPVFAESLQRLNEIGAFTFANPNAQIKLSSLFSKVKVAATVISGLFVLAKSKLQKKNETDEEMAKRFGVKYDADQTKAMLDWEKMNHLNAREKIEAAAEISRCLSCS